MKTTERVPKLALYACDCCGDEVVLDIDDHSSHCPGCDESCQWVFVERVFSWLEMEDPEPYAA